MDVIIDALKDGKVESLLDTHLKQMHKYSPEESIHALDRAQMREPSMTFWSIRKDNEVMGCGALKQISASTVELKSMKTNDKFLRMGVAETLLKHILQHAISKGYASVFLETGAHQAFLPAIKLYQKYGFVECEAFANYQPDPHSRFFKKLLD